MEQVGRYRLTRRLGQGGMAEVFEAVAEGEGGFRRRVALKRVLPQLSRDLSIARMFLDEARTTSHLHHGNIVSVLDYGSADGSAFQVLEFVDGLDLDGLLRRADERNKPLPVGLALHVVLQIAQALDYAHNAKDESGLSLSIVHRDVSPSNVLVSWDGHLKLSDFGIALAANRLERTEGAGVKGKLEYMSPEQVMRGNVDRRSDVFALGCMLHRIITGKSPLAELSALTRMASGEELSLDDQLDPPIREVIMRATRHAQTQRYASAAELSRALAGLLPSYLREEPSFAMQQWLAGLRDDAGAAKKRGALDALLDLELVLSSQDTASKERSFVIRTPLLSPPVGPVAALAAQEAPTPEVSEPNILAKSGGIRWLGATLLLIVALSALAFYAVRDASSMAKREPPALPKPAVSSGPRQVPEQPSDKAASRKEGVESPTLAPSEVVETALVVPSLRQQTAQAGRSKRARPRGQPRQEPARTPLPAPSPTQPTGFGTLVIGGDGALRAEIRIDGRSLGFAPKRVELSAGQHDILLLRPDGTKVGPRSVRIETHHTQSAPARWIVD